MTKDVVLYVPLVDQLRDTQNDDWKEKSCGICAVKMLMAFHAPDTIHIPVMALINEAVAYDGYLTHVGWKHRALVELAERHGVPLTFQKQFFYTPEEKKKGVLIIHRQIRSGKPVVASVRYGFRPESGGHLVVVYGLQMKGRSVAGYYVQDPYPGKEGNNYIVSSALFLAGWRGGMILFKE